MADKQNEEHTNENGTASAMKRGTAGCGKNNFTDTRLRGAWLNRLMSTMVLTNPSPDMVEIIRTRIGPRAGDIMAATLFNVEVAGGKVPQGCT